jgi:hypothetical protein
VGVDLGYRPSANGGADLVLHVSPATLQASRPGEPIEMVVPREAREIQPVHYILTPENEKLPGEVSTASLLPATAHFGPAAPMLPPAATAPVRNEAHVRPLLSPPNSARSTAATTWVQSKISSLEPVNSEGNSPGQPDRPWLAMCLLVIALFASNVYVVWLFWDARQRYRGLLTRAFSFGQPAAEA